MRGKGKRERGESGVVAKWARGPKGDKEPASQMDELCREEQQGGGKNF